VGVGEGMTETSSLAAGTAGRGAFVEATASSNVSNAWIDGKGASAVEAASGVIVGEGLSLPSTPAATGAAGRGAGEDALAGPPELRD
jgi:hypothetical protein